MPRIVHGASFATIRFRQTSRRIGTAVHRPSLARAMAAGRRTTGLLRCPRMARSRWSWTTAASASRRRRRKSVTTRLADDRRERGGFKSFARRERGMPFPPDHHHEFHGHGPDHGPPGPRDLSGSMKQTVTEIKQVLTPAQLQLWNELVGEPVTFDLHYSPEERVLVVGNIKFRECHHGVLEYV